MFLSIARFEFRFQRKSPVFWVSVAFFFLFAFAGMTIDEVQVGSGGNINANSPYAIATNHLIWSLFFMFASTAFVANVIVRDDETRYGPIVRSTAIRKFDYLFGRFAGAFLAIALAFAAIPLAVWLGSLMPWLDQETLGPNRLGDYLYSYFLLGLPTLFVTSAFFFALATITRSMMWTYLGVVGFFILYSVGTSLLQQQPQLETLVAYADPFALTAYGLVTEYWTAAERNTLNPPFSGVLLGNRLIWVAAGCALLALAYALYRFSDRGLSKRKERRRREMEAASLKTAEAPAQRLSEPLPAGTFGAATRRAQLWTRLRFEMRQIFKSPAYAVLLILAAGLAASGLWFGGEIYGTPPVASTLLVIQQLIGAFGLITIIVAIYYSGEVVWRERDRKMHELVDATSLPNWGYIVPKTIAVVLVLVSTLVVGVLIGCLLQLTRGNAAIDLGQYIAWFLVPMSFSVAFLAVLATFVQTLSPNKYAGWGIMVIYLIVSLVIENLGFEHNLYDYGSAPDGPLSDINGSGGFMARGWWFRLYWSGFAVALIVVAHLLWRRGTEQRLKPRLKRLPARLKGAPGLIALGALLVSTGAGAFVYYNTNVLNEYRTSDDTEAWQAAYEKKYLKYEDLPRPSVSDVRLKVDLYPAETRAEIQGAYRLTNRTEAPIRQVHIRTIDRDLVVKALALEGARQTSFDEEFGYRIFTLDTPMAPGESRLLSFRTQRWQRGFSNSGNETRLVHNGTFLDNSHFAPVVGMGRDGLLQDRSTRRKYGLPAELRVPKLEDVSATDENYIGDWTTADITVSTSADQTPIAPGKTVFDTVRGDRRIARFVSDAPILNFFSIQSARYAVERRRHAGVDLAVYYHPTHGRNVDRMLDALETSLDYYQANFGPYQFDQARIIEFPGYQTFAQAFANTIPYSEAIGFSADLSDPESIDYVTYITAHELAHQYWGHQISGAAMQGGTMLVETLAQYSALMVMKELLGEDQIRRFLQYELDMYLASRSGEAIEELPLGRVENQQYIHYRKGSLAMYLLQERLGEDAVNRALRTVLEKYRFKGAPYPRSLDLIEAFKAEAETPEQRRLVEDLFERITLYDLKVDEPTAERRADGKWVVSVPVEAGKFYADGKGKETAVALSEPIEIGLFKEEPGRGAFAQSDVILMERRPIRTGKQVLTFVVAEKPAFAGVDPYNFYVDRKSSDNVKPVA